MTVTAELTAERLAALLNAAAPVSPPWVVDLGDVDENRDLTEFAVYCPAADPAAVVALVTYFLRGPLAMGGEWYGEWAVIDGPLVRFPIDWTKSPRDDVAWVLTDPDTGLEAYLRTGSPIRKTDRAGAGTRGTRACPPLPGPALVLWR